MAASSQHMGIKFAEQVDEDKPPSLNRRLPRRASTFQYGAPADSSSDSEPDGRRIESKGVEEGFEDIVDRSVGSTESVPVNEHRRAGMFDIEENRNSPPRARFGFRIPRLFSKKPPKEEDVQSSSMYSSYIYSYYRSCSTVVLSYDDAIAKKLMVYHCHTEMSPLTTKRNMTRFDSSKHNPNVLGSDRQYDSPKRSHLIHNDEEAMSGLFRDVHSDSPWFATYGSRLRNQIQSEGLHALPRKTQLYRIRNDEKRQMAHGAICINHWVDALPDDDEEANDKNDDSSSDDDTDPRTVENDQLQQLIIFWQYRRSFEPGFHDEATIAPDSVPMHDPDLIEPVPETVARTGANPKSLTMPHAKSANTAAAGSTSAAHRKNKRSAATSQNVEEWREPLLRSNMIVVFEKSVIRSRNRKSIVLDDLDAAVSSGSLLVDKANMHTSNENLKGLNDIHSIEDVIERVFESLEEDLNMRIDSYVARCARLEREVHKKPENDSNSRKLWLCSRQFQMVKKKINTIAFLVDDIRHHLIQGGISHDFLSLLPSRLKIIAYDVDEDLRKPVVEMIDLVYKSISINDARRSMELNASLWRLSWVTFIFLPLTFLVGFFGMNVNVFANDPALQWYFIAAIPFFICIMISWLLFKHLMDKYPSFKDLLNAINRERPRARRPTPTRDATYIESHHVSSRTERY
ncbi:hypothetical protein P171DRAFT_440396 [Karstenula rhodostoma CBS 690.94]|uniref:Cora-domain-containing protein n=1 Tax=Karstenula rhodostoma CBS 690.94 TaxID=1392251 RepID=A0A9P4PT77_9PLEO|nr:hypothetical protein P171DRAFT_440396 [Karstenula rhodostoma CBS 690.94]